MAQFQKGEGPKKPHIISIRSIGSRAAKDGKGREACPYPMGTMDRVEWLGGWWKTTRDGTLRNADTYEATPAAEHREKVKRINAYQLRRKAA